MNRRKFLAVVAAAPLAALGATKVVAKEKPPIRKWVNYTAVYTFVDRDEFISHLQNAIDEVQFKAPIVRRA